MGKRLHCLLSVTLVVIVAAAVTPAQEMAEEVISEGIEIAEIERDEPVDFRTEVLPIFQQSCLACHNAKRAKAELVLESPQTIANGSESGPVVVPGRSDQSLLLMVAAHRDDPIMPPKNNKAKAPNLAPEQLGILKLWIDQGAKGDAGGGLVAMKWQPLSGDFNPIYAVTVSADGQYVACGRGNQVFVYHIPSGQLISRLADLQPTEAGEDELPGKAHRDLVHALAFSPDGQLLASGGYRMVKLWRRPRNAEKFELEMLSEQSEEMGDTSRLSGPVAASLDGQWLATGTRSNAILLWDLHARRVVATLTGHTDTVTSLCFSKESDYLYSGAEDKTVRAWSIPDGVLYAVGQSPVGVNVLTWVGGPAQVASAGEDQSIQVWTLPEQAGSPLGLLRQISGHTMPVTCLDTFRSDGQQVVSGSRDGTVRIWKIETGEQVRMLNHGSPIAAVAVRPDGQALATGGLNNMTYLWDVATGKRVAELQGDRYADERVGDLERRLAFAASQVDRWSKTMLDLEQGQKAAIEALTKANEQEGAARKRVEENQFAHDKSLKARSVTAKSFSAVNDLVDRSFASTALAAFAAELRGEDQLSERTVAKMGTALQQAKAGEISAGVAHHEALVALRDALTSTLDARSKVIGSRREHRQAQGDLKEARSAASNARKPIRAIAFSPDGRLIATAGEASIVSTFRADDGHPFDTFEGHTAAVTSLCITQGAIISAAVDQRVVVWDREPPWQLQQVIGSGDERSPIVDRVLAVAFSPYGDHLATGGGRPSRDGEIKLWRVFDGKLVREFSEAHTDTVFGLAFSDDARFLASGAADKFVKVFHVSDGTLAKSFEGHTHHVLGVSWNRNNQVLASSGADREVKIWDFLSGQRKTSIATFEKEVTSIHYIGYSDQALVSAGDPRVSIISESGLNVRTFNGPSNYLFCSDVTPDGEIIVAGGQDSLVYVWDAEGNSIATFAPPAQEESQISAAANPPRDGESPATELP